MSPFATTFVSHNQSTSLRTLWRSLLSENVHWLNVLTFIFVVVVCLAYIVQINGSISKGYEIRELETQIQELTLMNQSIELSMQQSQSLKNVERSVKMLGLVEAERPEYVSLTEPSYALAP